MSLVQAYIYKDFILVGGEQRAELSNGQIIENFVKVRKLNDTVIIGMTGTIEGNAILFSEFINNDFTIREYGSNYSYKEIISKIHQSYYNNWEYLQEHNVHSVVCGWDGEKFTGFSYFTKDNDTSLNRPIDLTPEHEEQVRIVNCGLKMHYEEALRLISISQPHNIRQFRNLFMDVIDNGIKFDKGINRNVTFEKIRKVDVV